MSLPEGKKGEDGSKGDGEMRGAGGEQNPGSTSEPSEDLRQEEVKRIVCAGMRTRASTKNGKAKKELFTPAYIGLVTVGGQECRVCVADCGACTSII